MWIQSLSLIGSLAVFFITPISPDLSKVQKGFIGVFSGSTSIVSLISLTKSPLSKIKRLERDLDLNQKGFRDAEAKLIIVQSNLENSENEYQQLLSKIDELEKAYSSLVNEEKGKFEQQLKIKLQKINDNHLAEIKNQSQVGEEKLKKITEHYEQKLNEYEEKLNEYLEKETYLKELISENEQAKKLLEIDRKTLDLEASQIQLNVERQVFSHQEALNNSIKENEDLRLIIEGNRHEIAQLNQMIILLQNEAEQPKNPDIRQIIKLFSGKKIRIKYISTSDICGIISHDFEPLSEFDESDIKAVCQQLPGFLKELKCPPSYAVSGGKISIKIDKREVKDKIKKIDENWLIDIAKSESNLLILGARGTGKSELANNYSALILENVPNIKYKFIQPKPDDFSVFYLGDKEIKPDYLGFQDIPGIKNAYEGLDELNNTIHARLEDNTKRLNAGLKCQNWSPQYWIIDEFQQLILQAKGFDRKPEEISLNVRNAVSLGRSLKVYVLAIGQIPNVSDLKWKISDLYQFCQIYLGDAIKNGIGYSPSKSDEIELNNQFDLYRGSNIKYYGLVRKMGDKGFIAELPNVRKYFKTESSHSITESSQDITESDTHHTPSQTLESLPDKECDKSHPITSHHVTPSKMGVSECPHCGSFESVKNGKNRRKCKKCCKTYSI